MTLANSKTEDYVCKINRLYDIYLERDLRHLENERKFYLKTFRADYRVAKEKCDKITNKAKEYRRLRLLKSKEVSPLEHSATGTKRGIFITDAEIAKMWRAAMNNLLTADQFMMVQSWSFELPLEWITTELFVCGGL